MHPERVVEVDRQTLRPIRRYALIAFEFTRTSR